MIDFDSFLHSTTTYLRVEQDAALYGSVFNSVEQLLDKDILVFILTT